MISILKVKTTYPTESELVEVRKRDKKCVYCGKKFDSNSQTDRPTTEHLNHKQDWDSVGSYRREGKPISEIVAICCKACNSSRGSKSLSAWFKSPYCINRKREINYENVDQVVRNYIDKYENN